MEASRPTTEEGEGAQSRVDAWVPGLSGGSSYGDTSSASGESAVGGGRETPAGEEDTRLVDETVKEKKEEDERERDHEDRREDERVTCGQEESEVKDGEEERRI